MEFHDARDLGKQFKVDAVTIRRWEKSGRMPAADKVAGTTIRWPASRIEAWIRAGCVPVGRAMLTARSKSGGE